MDWHRLFGLFISDFFTNSPFEVELDGSYYNMLGFFQRVGKLERIINVGGLKMASIKKANELGSHKQYEYSASETVAATCTATAFFSHDPGPAQNPQAVQPPQPGARPAAAPAPTRTAQAMP